MASKRSRNTKKGLGSSQEPERGIGIQQRSEKSNINIKNQEKYPENEGFETVNDSALTGITSEKQLMIVSTTMASSREDSPSRRSRLVLHDLEAARAQSMSQDKEVTQERNSLNRGQWMINIIIWRKKSV